MSPDDPRHGTTRGFHAGCHEPCCRRARALDEKIGRLARLSGGRAIPALGSQRRIRALMALGWTSQDIAEACGWPHYNYVLRIINGQKGKPTTWLERKTARTIAATYEALSMTVPEMNGYRKRGRTLALRKGYLPPLAWDDIDNDPEPVRVEAPDPRYAYDHAVVERFLAGDQSLPTSVPERVEIVRRWQAMGRSLGELERATGWASCRYTNREDGAA